MTNQPISVGANHAVQAMLRQRSLERRYLAARALAVGLGLGARLVSPSIVIAGGCFFLSTFYSRVADDTRLLVSLFVVAVVIVVAHRAADRLEHRLERAAFSVSAPKQPVSGLRRWTTRLATVLGIGLISFWLLLLLALDHKYRERRAELDDDYAAFTATFILDRARTSASVLFADTGTARDAGAVLNQAGFTGKMPTAASLSMVLPTLPVAVEESTFEAVAAADIAGLDTDWMRDLSAFDHWDLDAAAARNHAHFDFRDGFPDFDLLVRWAKVRAAQGYLENDVRNASNDIRSLARLTASLELQVSTMVGITMLAIDRDLVAAEGRRHPATDLSWWIPFTEEDGEAARRSTFAAAVYVGDLDAPVGARGIVDGTLPVDCVALQEWFGRVRGEGDALERHDPATAARADEKIISVASTCRFHALREHWSEPSPPVTLCDGTSATPRCAFNALGRWLPFAGRPAWRLDSVECMSPTSCFKEYKRR